MYKQLEVMQGYRFQDLGAIQWPRCLQHLDVESPAEHVERMAAEGVEAELPEVKMAGEILGCLHNMTPYQTIRHGPQALTASNPPTLAWDGQGRYWAVSFGGAALELPSVSTSASARTYRRGPKSQPGHQGRGT